MDDAKIALLISVLEPASFPIDDYAEALRAANGNVQAAAEALLLPRVKSAGKRKAGSSLQQWLGKDRRGTADRGVGGADGGAGETNDNHVAGEHWPAETINDPVPTSSDKAEGGRELARRKRRAISAVAPGSSSESLPSPSRAAAPEAKPPRKDAFALLRKSGANAGGSTKPKAVPQPALRLATQQQLDAHDLPLTLLGSPLSPALASALYLAMMDEAEDKWERNRWYLAGRWVESPHTTHMYARHGQGYDNSPEARYFYSGTDLGKPPDYPALLKTAADLIEPVVNAALAKRRRFPLEWAGEWRANVCGTNRYDGASSGVGWHADQLTYLGPYATIASLSLGTPRAFRLRQTDSADPAYSAGKPIRTYEVVLGHNSLVLMNGGCQERYKHTVPSQKALDLFRPGWDIEQNPIPPDKHKTYTSRINITFRFYRTDFAPLPGLGPSGPRQGTPVCKCGMPTLLRADQKAKARSRLGPPSPAKPKVVPILSPTKPPLPVSSNDNNGVGDVSLASQVLDDDMMFFWQCQSPGLTGDLKGCGFFRILDMKAEGRGPCIGDV